MNLIEITDINAPELDVFSRITEPQLRTYFEPEIGIFLAETANVIMRAIEAGYEPLSMLVETERLEAEAGPVFECIEKHCGKEKLESMPVYIAGREIVTKLTGYTLVRGLWMTLRRRPEMSVEEFCRDKKRITVLMDVVNPTNVGAIIRSAAALGMDGVLLTHASVDPLTRRSARVSMGLARTGVHRGYMQVVGVRMGFAGEHAGHDDPGESAGNLLLLLHAVHLDADRGHRVRHFLRGEVTLQILLEPIVTELHIFVLLSISNLPERKAAPRIPACRTP